MLWPVGLISWGVGLGFGVGLARFTLSEAIAFAVHLKDVDVMGHTVEERTGQAFRPKGFGPLVEWQVAGDPLPAGDCATIAERERCSPLIALRDQLEQKLGAGFAERHEAQLVNNQKLVAICPALRKGAGLVLPVCNTDAPLGRSLCDRLPGNG